MLGSGSPSSSCTTWSPPPTALAPVGMAYFPGECALSRGKPPTGRRELLAYPTLQADSVLGLECGEQHVQSPEHAGDKEQTFLSSS